LLLSLYYARSANAGNILGEAMQAVDPPVTWQEIVADGLGNLHRLWQQGVLATVWDQTSSDYGQSWQPAQRVPAEWWITFATADLAGQLHLLGIGRNSLDHWLWDGTHWLAETTLQLPFLQAENPVELLAAAVNKDGRMLVVMSLAKEPGEAAGGVLYTVRTIEQPALPTPSAAAAVETLSPIPTRATATPQPTPTATGLIKRDV
jgi:hypothetical protein